MKNKQRISALKESLTKLKCNPGKDEFIEVKWKIWKSQSQT
jgi:hypothetical protein